ncbi:putative reverse transcriptase domain-containing protein [Tanacetum coccineum]
MPNTRSGVSMTHEEVEELVTRRVAKEMGAHEAAINLEPVNENEDEQECRNRGNGNGGNRGNGNGGNRGNVNGGNGGNGNGGNGENGNGNRNGNHGMNYGGFMPVARECTFQDFLKCKPHNFSGTEGTNVARAYTVGNNDRKGYAGPHPLCNKCGYHHVGPCTVKCNNCKRVGHQTRDCRSVAAEPNTQRDPLGSQQGVICYECGRLGHVKRECPKLRNQNHGNRVGNKTGNQTGGNEATARAYAIGGGGTNPDSNVVTGDNFDGGSKLNIISCTRTQKYIQKGCQVYLKQVTSKKVEDKSEEKRLEDVPIV